MFITEVLIVAIRGVMANKLRTLLTVLGIVVGVGSVITLLAYSEGTKQDLLKRFEAWGANRMGVFLGGGWGDVMDLPAGEELTLDDLQAIQTQCSTIELASPTNERRMEVRYGTTTLSEQTICATDPDYFTINNDTLDRGGFSRRMKTSCASGCACWAPKRSTSCSSSPRPWISSC